MTSEKMQPQKFRVVKFVLAEGAAIGVPAEVVGSMKAAKYGVQVTATEEILADFGSKEEAELFIENGDAERELTLQEEGDHILKRIAISPIVRGKPPLN